MRIHVAHVCYSTVAHINCMAMATTDMETVQWDCRSFCRLAMNLITAQTTSSPLLPLHKMPRAKLQQKSVFSFPIPFSAYISRVFNFANIANLESFAKFIQRKFEPLHCNTHG